jgi:hypothetical protein
MNDTLAAEKSALEVQRSAARSEKQKEKIEASAKVGPQSGLRLFRR